MRPLTIPVSLATERPTVRPADATGLAGPVLLGGTVFAGLLPLADRLLNDPDTQWHVAVGDGIRRDGAVPWTDTLSHTFAGSPWIAKEWLSQVVLSRAHAIAGWDGVAILTAALLALTFATLFGWLARRLRLSVALGGTFLAVALLASHFLARPHVFGFLALTLWTAGLLAARERDAVPAPWTLAVLVLWANLHGSFTVAYPLAGMAGLEAVLLAPGGARCATALRWAGFGLLCVAAGLLTPYGMRAALVTFELARGGEALPFLTEWQPLRLDPLGLAALGSAVALVACLAADPARNLVRMVAIGGLMALTLRHGRFLDVSAIVAPMLAAGPIARRWPALRPEAPTPGAVRGRTWLAAGCMAVAGIVLAATIRPALNPAVTPEAALAAARRAGVSGPVYNDYDFGGFLIAHGVPTFIDGRTDQLFLGGFMTAVFAAAGSETPEPLLALLDRYRVSWAIVRPESGEARHLAASGWTRLHRDSSAIVFTREPPPSR